MEDSKEVLKKLKIELSHMVIPLPSKYTMELNSGFKNKSFLSYSL
jgi:hypothetical protein